MEPERGELVVPIPISMSHSLVSPGRRAHSKWLNVSQELLSGWNTDINNNYYTVTVVFPLLTRTIERYNGNASFLGAARF